MEWERLPGRNGRVASLPEIPEGAPGFRLVPPDQSGVAFTNHLGQDLFYSRTVVQNGSGVALGDIDGDGLCDLYLCRLEGGNRLFRNLGDWRFTDITAQSSGIACVDQASSGAVLADVNGDGSLDLLVSGMGAGTRLFRNDGSGVFREDTGSGLLRRYAATSMTLADVDGDGDLDLYVANYRTLPLNDQPNIRLSLSKSGDSWLVTRVNGRALPANSEWRDRFVSDPDGNPIEAGEPDQLYLNDGHGRFRPLDAAEWFVIPDGDSRLAVSGYGLSAMFRDVNGDGFPDLYVCNDHSHPDRFWINRGGTRFELIPSTHLRQTSWSSMGVDFADVNLDGRDDFFVVDMLARRHTRRQRQLERGLPRRSVPGEWSNQPQSPRNTFFVQRQDGSFAEIAGYSGLTASDWSWTPVFLDVDLDGDEDLLVTNGFFIDVMDSDAHPRVQALRRSPDAPPDLRRHYPEWQTPNAAFRNTGSGSMRFEEAGEAWGFDQSGVSNGMALGDLDNDGDLDAVVNQLNGRALLLENRAAAPRVAVRLRGRGGNSAGIGARLTFFGGAVPRQSQEMICGGRYLSGDEPIRTFAAGPPSPDRSMRLEVRWPGGRTSVIHHVQSNRIYEVDERSAAVDSTGEAGSTHDRMEGAGTGTGTGPGTNPVLFGDVSHLLEHEHRKAPHDDRLRQPLMSRGLSRLGPGIAWIDVNGDGWEDLAIGSGRGGQMRVMLNDRDGGFKVLRAPAWMKTQELDQSGMAAFSAEPGSFTLLVGQSRYEHPSSDQPAIEVYRVWAGGLERAAVGDAFPGSVGPVALGDMDGDGDIDLFAGGRVIPGRYPAAASSRIYRRQGGSFELDAKAGAVLEKVGLVSGAVWTDLDRDGYPELLLACEWGPVKVFGNRAGILEDQTERWGTNDAVGWWNGITAGDLDGDGLLDVVATNWGLNTRYEPYRQMGLRVYHGDADGDGGYDVIEACWIAELGGAWVPWADREQLFRQLPGSAARAPDYRAYAESALGQLLGDVLDELAVEEVRHLESTVFWNRDGRLIPEALPVEAQWTPAFGVNVADLDGDGAEDVFLSQNFFDLLDGQSRHDSGRGLWIRGDGRGGLEAVGADRSGIRVDGEGRGSAVCDYDGDGRLDLVVGQNAGRTRLFRNVGGRPGLRVRLRGPAGNLTGLGAQLRLILADGKPGPVREVHGGAGYWSQDGAVAVMGVRPGSAPARVQVLWPGGRRSDIPVPRAARELLISHDGSSRVMR